MPLTTRADYKTYAGVTGTDLDSVIDVLLSAAESRVKDYCGRSFEDATFTEYHNGSGSQRIVLKEPPVASIASVQLIDAEGNVEHTYDAADYVESDGILSLAPRSEWAATVINPFGPLRRTSFGPGYGFPMGWKNVKVVYAGGYATIPADLVLAVWQLIDLYRSERGGGLTMQFEALGGVSYSRLNRGAIESAILWNLRAYRRNVL